MDTIAELSHPLRREIQKEVADIELKNWFSKGGFGQIDRECLSDFFVLLEGKGQNGTRKYGN
jgi:hypothetical protein